MSVLGLEKLRERISSFGLIPLGCFVRHYCLRCRFVFVSKVVKDWSGPVRLTTDDDSGPPTTTCSKIKIFTAKCRFLSTVLPPVPICGLLPSSIQSAPGLPSVYTVSSKPWVPPSRLRAPDQPPPPVSPLCLLPFHFLSPKASPGLNMSITTHPIPPRHTSPTGEGQRAAALPRRPL